MSIEVQNQDQASDSAIQQAEQQPLQDYIIEKTLGEGNFGKVKKGIHKITGQQVAIKILEKDLIFEKTDIERISRQIKIMKQVRHPNIIQLYEIIETSKRLYLIMQFAKNGDLFDQIVNKEELPQQVAQEYFAQLIIGLQYLHSLGITHRDLKPENLLLSSDSGQVKIADFGLGNFFSNNETLKTACGSPCYAPPQMLNKLAYDPRMVDLWSSGIILHAMVLGYLPFEDDVTSKLYEKIKNSDFKLPFRLSLPCKNLIRSLLTKDPIQRIKLIEVKEHEWLKASIENYTNVDFQVDQKVFKVVCDRFGIVEQQRLLSSLKKNKHNNLTTLYYLGEKVVKKEKSSEREGSRTSWLKQDITFKNLVSEAESDASGDAIMQKEKDIGHKKISQEEPRVSPKKGKSSEKIKSLDNIAPPVQNGRMEDQDESDKKSEAESDDSSLEAYSNILAVKAESKTEEQEKVNFKKQRGRDSTVEYGVIEQEHPTGFQQETNDLQTSQEFMKQEKDRFEEQDQQQTSHHKIEEEEPVKKNSIQPEFTESFPEALSELKELQNHFESEYHTEKHQRQGSIEQIQDMDIEPMQAPSKVSQTPPKQKQITSLKKKEPTLAKQKVTTQPKQDKPAPIKQKQSIQLKQQKIVEQPKKKPVKQKQPIAKEKQSSQKKLEQSKSVIQKQSSIPEQRQSSPPKQRESTPPKQIASYLKNKKIQKKANDKKHTNREDVKNNLNKTLPTSFPQSSKRLNEVAKIIKEKQAPKKLVKNQRMPIHNPHVSDKPAPPLYEHSQSKEKPLILKRITAKASNTEPHLVDPKRLVLCSIEHFTSVLEQKGLGGRLEYYQIGKGNNSAIYIMKNGITGKGVSLVIKDINEKCK